MREYELFNIVNAHFFFNHHCRAVNYFGSVISYHMNAEKLFVFFIYNKLHYSVAAFVFGNISAAVFQRYGDRLCVKSFCFYAFARFTYGGDFGICIYNGRN